MEFIIYGKPNCQYCAMAKTTLEQGEYPFKYLTVDEDFVVTDLIELVIAKTGVRPTTFPQIFIQEEDELTHLGGFSELRSYLATAEE